MADPRAFRWTCDLPNCILPAIPAIAKLWGRLSVDLQLGFMGVSFIFRHWCEAFKGYLGRGSFGFRVADLSESANAKAVNWLIFS